MCLQITKILELDSDCINPDIAIVGFLAWYAARILAYQVVPHVCVFVVRENGRVCDLTLPVFTWYVFTWHNKSQ